MLKHESHGAAVYTPKDAAQVLKIGKSKIYELIASGEIPSIRLGKRCLRIPAAALSAYLARATAVGE